MPPLHGVSSKSCWFAVLLLILLRTAPEKPLLVSFVLQKEAFVDRFSSKFLHSTMNPCSVLKSRAVFSRLSLVLFLSFSSCLEIILLGLMTPFSKSESKWEHFYTKCILFRLEYSAAMYHGGGKIWFLLSSLLSPPPPFELSTIDRMFQ